MVRFCRFMRHLRYDEMTCKIARRTDDPFYFHISCHFPTQKKVRGCSGGRGDRGSPMNLQRVRCIPCILVGEWRWWFGRRTRPISASRLPHRRRSTGWSFLYEVPGAINNFLSFLTIMPMQPRSLPSSASLQVVLCDCLPPFGLNWHC